jgi:hypothetical protein
MTQRTTMVLLLLLVIGVWGLLLRPAVTPIPVQAQNGGGNNSSSGLVATPNGLFLYTPAGYIYHFAPDLSVQDRAVPPNIDPNSATYAVQHRQK